MANGTTASPTLRPGGETREAAVTSKVKSSLTSPTVPAAAKQTAVPLTVKPGEITDPTEARFQVDAGQNLVSQGAALATPVQAQQITAGQVAPAEIDTALSDVASAAVDTALDPAAVVDAATAELPEEALVTTQLNQLLEGIESGQIPAFAQPAVDAVNAQLAARGLSASSVGRAALTNAIIQAATPLAQSNATALQSNFAQNKQFEQEANIRNALSAQGLQLQNLSNEQQASMVNAAAKQQFLLSNQASENAAQQFNATSQNQVNQFNSNLKATIDSQNAARFEANKQFNAQQTNAMKQFSENIKFSRDQFNAQNAATIEQSNVQWRRQTNTTTTAAVNAVNQANAMNAFNLSNQALTFMWQESRDAAKWSFEAAENDKQRAAALAQAALGADSVADANTSKYVAAIGAAALNVWKES